MPYRYPSYLTLLILFFFYPSFASARDNGVLSLGNPNAKVTIKVFSSLTCPHCASFHLEVFDKLMTDFIDKNLVKYEHHSFPLDIAALNADIIVKCELEPVDSFMVLYKIYKNQGEWAIGKDIKKINDKIMKVAQNPKLDRIKMEKCLVNEKIQDSILNERISAQKKYNITSTPTIYINEKIYKGNHKYKDFKKEIEKNL